VKRHENRITGVFNRALQILARFSPGATTFRVWLHRWRGVRIGKRVWIGYDAIIETSYPHLVEIQEDAVVGIRATIIAHFRESRGVVVEEGAFLGPGVIVMPNVRVGKGAVVTAGSVVTSSVAPMTLVQGNPARPVAKVGVMLSSNISLKQFLKHLRPLDHR
jgi:acetyltransferase-like isoleucine patch superfamily enzyme